MMEFEDHPTEPNTIVIKMPKRYIAKHSDEDLRAAVLAEREACAKIVDENLFLLVAAAAIRARDMYTKPQNIDTSAEHVHEIDKSIHEQEKMCVSCGRPTMHMGAKCYGCCQTAQPEQEHKPWCDYLNIMLTSLPPQRAKCNCKQVQPWDTSDMAHRIGGLSIDQEPVAWMYVNEDGECEQIEYGVSTVEAPYITLLYTAPPSKEWVSLTEEEVDEEAIKCVKSGQSVNAAIRAIEAKLKEKNT